MSETPSDPSKPDGLGIDSIDRGYLTEMKAIASTTLKVVRHLTAVALVPSGSRVIDEDEVDQLRGRLSSVDKSGVSEGEPFDTLDDERIDERRIAVRATLENAVRETYGLSEEEYDFRTALLSAVATATAGVGDAARGNHMARCHSVAERAGLYEPEAGRRDASRLIDEAIDEAAEYSEDEGNPIVADAPKWGGATLDEEVGTWSEALEKAGYDVPDDIDGPEDLPPRLEDEFGRIDAPVVDEEYPQTDGEVLSPRYFTTVRALDERYRPTEEFLTFVRAYPDSPAAKHLRWIVDDEIEDEGGELGGGFLNRLWNGGAEAALKAPADVYNEERLGLLFGVGGIATSDEKAADAPGEVSE